MTFAEVLNALEPEYGRINFREHLILRKAFDLILKDRETITILLALVELYITLKMKTR